MLSSLGGTRGSRMLRIPHECARPHDCMCCESRGKRQRFIQTRIYLLFAMSMFVPVRPTKAPALASLDSG